jgi:alanyl-tRNA synthetase
MADAVVAEHSEFPRLAGARDEALCYIREESERFRKTLARGKRRFEEFLKENDGNTLTGDQIIHLEKRKGVPSLLVEIWLLEQELSFDRVGYEDAWRRWRTALEKRLEKNGQEA